MKKNEYDYMPKSFSQTVRGQHTFSINIFQWVLKEKGDGLKRTKCVVRVYSPVEKEKEAFSTANKIVNELNNGCYKGANKIRIKL